MNRRVTRVRKLFGLIVGAAVVFSGCFPPTAPDETGEALPPRDFSWSFLDGGGPSDGLDETTGEILDVDTATLGGELYVAWVELSSVRVSRYDGGTTWTAVDAGGLNLDGSLWPSGSYFQKISLQAFDGRLYLAWIEDPSDAFEVQEPQIRVAAYDPASPGWTYVHGGQRLNSSGLVAAGGPVLTATADKLYAVWQEGTPSRLFAAEYNGNDLSPAWTTLGDDVINYSEGSTAYRPDAAAFKGKLIVIWDEDQSPTRDDIRAKAYDPNAGGTIESRWSEVDGGSLNRVPGENGTVDSPGMLATADALYVYWTEENTEGVEQVRARMYDGSTWTLIDGEEEAGLNFDSEQSAGWEPVAPAVVDGQIAAAFTEENSTGILQLRAIILDGTADNPDPRIIDGGASTGLNVEPSTYDALNPAATGYNGNLVIAWIEQVGAAAADQNVRVIIGQ